MSGTPGAAALEALVADLDYPMAVVTVVGGASGAGCLVGFWTQCSIDPHRLLVCLSKRNYTYRVARDARSLAVHFLRSDDLSLARVFGEETGDDVDKLSLVEWTPGPGGLPVLAGVRGWVCGEVIERFDVGDHVAHLLEVTDGEVQDVSSAALTFQQVKNFDPGHDA
jgi:flavin reductase (DIM6/NTAB) family NADH-FMN oxidoreductase RutF